MIVQHNIMALNSHRQLNTNNTSLQRNLEKLSSGYRINRAADDAAGLAISQRMRAQIAGLERAILNAQDGASLIQTAEGALTEVHSILNRMKELGTQAANGTYGETDRNKIESEIEAMKEEIDRISQATNFNGINLLDGSLSSNSPKDIEVKGVKVSEIPATAGVYAFDVALHTDLQGTDNVAPNDQIHYNIGLNNGDSFTFTFTVSADGKYLIANDSAQTPYELATAGTLTEAEFNNALHDQVANSKLNDRFIVKMNASDGLTLVSRAPGTSAPQVTSASVRMNNDGYKTTAPDTANSVDPSDTISGILPTALTMFRFEGSLSNEDVATFSVNGVNFILISGTAAQIEEKMAKLENRDVNVIKISGSIADANNDDLTEIAAQINQKTGMAFRADLTSTPKKLIVEAPKIGNGLTMQVGDTAADYNKITVSVDDMSAMGLGIGSISMTTQESAARALDRVNAAIEKVSVNRGNLGALQNRLEHTRNNLSVTTENMTEAESRIRDVDMAKEMMLFTKNNVLSQAAQAMLAQANQQPQQVLQLLR